LVLPSFLTSIVTISREVFDQLPVESGGKTTNFMLPTPSDSAPCSCHTANTHFQGFTTRAGTLSANVDIWHAGQRWLWSDDERRGCWRQYGSQSLRELANRKPPLKPKDGKAFLFPSSPEICRSLAKNLKPCWGKPSLGFSTFIRPYPNMAQDIPIACIQHSIYYCGLVKLRQFPYPNKRLPIVKSRIKEKLIKTRRPGFLRSTKTLTSEKVL
jgi:hypothetical protein